MNEKIMDTIYKSTKLTIDFFMYMPQVNKWKDAYNVKSYPILSIRKLTPNNYNEDVGDFKARTFKINPASYIRVVSFFNTIVSWFYDENKKDLFLKDADGKLLFNGDYKDLSLLVESGTVNVDRMKAVPAVIETADGESREGIYLMINSSEIIIPLTLKEVEIILDVLASFSFKDQMIISLLAIDYATRNNTITESDPYTTSNPNKPKW